jgi:hypothetical protein
MTFMICLRSISLLNHLIERNRNLTKAKEAEALAAAQRGDRALQSIASTESERYRAVWHELQLVLDEYHTRDEQLLHQMQQLKS